MRARVGGIRSWVAVLGSLAVTAAGAGLVLMLPRFVGVTWSAIGTTLAVVPVPALVGLVVLWLVGLLVHVPVQRAAMPGLTVRQALVLNLSGSAVSNLLPLGGPAGMGLGYAMTHGWGFRSDRFASYTLSTNLWNAVAKFVLGISVLAVASLTGFGLPPGLGRIVLSATGFVALGAISAVLALRTEQSTVAVGRMLDRVIGAVHPGAAVSAAGSVWLLSSRRELLVAVAAGWKQMSTGVLCYLVLQAALLFGCLVAVGSAAPVSVVLVAFAIERLISLAPITPGASGLAELGTVAALHRFGVDPVGAAAGVLLYRSLMFGIEIPIGSSLILGWLHGVRRARAVAGRGPAELAPARPALLGAVEHVRA